MGTVLSVAVAVGVPLAVSIGIGVTLQKDVKGWYKKLKKPSWTPPNWVFGPVWTALYTLMGVSSWMVWNNGGGYVPLTLYGIQLLLNLAWSPLFFKSHEIGYAMADITALLGFLTATVVKFHEVSPEASYLLMPYLGWSTYAAALTYKIWKDNPHASEGKSAEDVARGLGDTAVDAAVTARDNIMSAVDEYLPSQGEVEDKANKAANTVEDKANKAADKGKQAADKAADKGKETADQAKSAAGDAKKEVKKNT